MANAAGSKGGRGETRPSQHRTMLDEDLHQPIGQGDLVGRLSAVFFGNPFKRSSKEVINMTGQEFGTDG